MEVDVPGSSAKAAGNGRVPSLCYSNKQRRTERPGELCLPIMSFDTPKGGAVCVHPWWGDGGAS